MRMEKTCHVMSCGPWMKGRPFLLLKWMSAGSYVSTLLSCPLRVPLWLALAFHQRAVPTVDRKNGCGLSACSHLVSVMRGKSKSLLFSWNLGGGVAINY